MWASASFVGVLIVIGLPLWWKTTEVYRVSLPFDKIDSFKLEFHKISSEVVVFANDEVTAADLAELIKKEFYDSDILNLTVTHGVMSKHLHYSLDSAADNQVAVEEAGGALDLTRHNRIYVLQRKPLFHHTWLGTERLVFFRDSKAGPAVVQTLKQWVYTPRVLAGSAAAVADAARRERVPPADVTHLVLYTQLHQGTLDAAVDDYIGSFLDELSVLHNFTLNSQWLYKLNFDFQATEIKDKSEWGRHYKVDSQRLHVLVSRLEERAAARGSQLSTVSLLLYLLPCNIAPLLIYEGDKPVSSPVQAFLSPKWGGVVFVNPTQESCRTGEDAWDPNLRLVMGTFIAQLRTLLGIIDYKAIEGALLEPLRGVAPRAWELDSLLRIRTLEQLTSAERTLQSLAQLLGEISNIVINDEVGECINSAVSSIEVTHSLLSRGELVAAYRESQRAHIAAETAFMDPSLLALLYFPDDQKYAIYIPLFLPIMFPVVLSLKNLLLWVRGKPVHKDKTD